MMSWRVKHGLIISRLDGQDKPRIDSFHLKAWYTLANGVFFVCYAFRVCFGILKEKEKVAATAWT
jgi:hypothetical protein